jgi:hypothetical protein
MRYKIFSCLIYYTTPVLKIHLFFKNNLKNKKAPQQMPKGLELAGSPYWSASELFVGVAL